MGSKARTTTAEPDAALVALIADAVGRFSDATVEAWADPAVLAAYLAEQTAQNWGALYMSGRVRRMRAMQAWVADTLGEPNSDAYNALKQACGPIRWADPEDAVSPYKRGKRRSLR